MNNTSGVVAPIIVDILTQEMGLSSELCWVRDQERQIPNIKKLFVVVGMVNTPAILSNVTSMEQVTVGETVSQIEVNQVQTQENIQIDLCSKNNDAITRSWEAIAAMQSLYSQQQQELYNFKIFRTPRSFVNTSGLEGGSQVNRYSITIPTFVWYRKQKTLTPTGGDYYDDFTQRADDSQTIGTDTPLIEFEINSGGIVP